MFSEMLESTAAIGKQAIVRKKKSSVKQERQISGDTAKPTAYVDKIQPVYNVGAVSAAPTPPAWRPMVGDDGAMKEEPVRKRSKQNRVHWASDDNLVVVHYFESETDEHELVNTCREKYGCDLKHYEMLREREALQAAKKNIQLAGTTDDEVLVIGRGSYRLMPLDDVQRTGEVGRESEERAQFKKSCAVALHEVLYIENALPPTPSDNGIDRNVTREHMTATKPTSSVNELPSASYRRPAEMVPVVLPSEVPLQQSGYVDPASSDYCRPSGPPYGVPPTVRPETSTDVVIYSEPYAYRQPIPEAVNLPGMASAPCQINNRPVVTGAMNPMHPRMPFTRPPSLNVRAPPTAAGSMYPPPATGEGTSMRSWSGPPSGLLGNAPMAPIANQSGPQFSGPSRCRFPNVPQQGVPYRRYPPPPSSRGPFPRQPFRDVTTGKPPCHFFQQGRCGYGVRCRFPHVLVDDPALSGCRPAGGPPPIRSGEFPGSYGSAGDWAPEEPMEWDS